MIKIWVASIPPVPLGIKPVQWQSDCARELLRKSLIEMGIQEELTFGYHKNGKPYLLAHPEVRFNLSHSGQKVACAVSNREVGVDIQQVRSCNPHMIQHLSQDEQEHLLREPEENRHHEQIRLWTMKESYMKYTGEGFRLPLDSFSVLQESKEYSIDTRIIEPDYYVSVCGEKGQSIEWKTYS